MSFKETTIRIPSVTPSWTLEAWQFQPTASSPSTPPPVVVMAHGFGLTKRSSLRDYAETFARMGYGVLVFDYRRFGGSDGTPRNMLFVNEQLDDYRTVIKYARESGLFDPKRVVVWGTSFSGGHSIQLASEDHELAAAIAQCPFADGITSLLGMSIIPTLKLVPYEIYDFVTSFLPGYKPLYVPTSAPYGKLGVLTEPGTEEGMWGITPNPEDYANQLQASGILQVPFYSPLRHAHKIECPILLSIAKSDNLTPASAALKVVQRAPLAESVRFEGGHYDCYPGFPNHKTSIESMKEFLQRVVPV